MISRATQVYASDAEPEDVFLSLRELFSYHPLAMFASTDTLAELLVEKLLIEQGVDSFEVEIALEALRVESVVLA